jgi:hypothetical protein
MTNFDSLQALAGTYPSVSTTALSEISRGYQRRDEQEILDIAAIAADISTDSILNMGLEPESNPLLAEAFGSQYPGVDPNSLVGASGERLEGFVNGLKGKYFEHLVRERLNNGERVGELFLQSGQRAEIAESATQAGWDLRVVNSDGSVSELFQLKATTSMAYIKRAFEEYPDIRIAVPSDVDAASDNLLGTDISHQTLEQAARDHVSELGEDAFTNIVQQGTEVVFDSLPLVPAVMIVATEGRLVLLGRSSLEESFERGAKRLGEAAIFTSLGSVLHAIDAGVITIPATTAARIGWKRIVNRIAEGDYMESRAEEIKRSVGNHELPLK